MIKKVKVCGNCELYVSGKIPNLCCGHFICPNCYVKFKSLNSSCNCPFCIKTLKRRLR
jgi:hypothetical protein